MSAPRLRPFPSPSRLFLGLAACSVFGAPAFARQASFPEVEVQVPCIEGAEPVVLCYRQWASCSIDSAVDTDVFQFFGSAGDVVQLTLFSISGLDPLIRILNGSGAVIEMNSCSNNCSFPHVFTVPVSGQYTLLVSDSDLDEGGSYQLSLERLRPSASVPALDYGVTEVFAIDHATDIDFATFEGTAGTLVDFTMSSSNGLDPLVKVYAPDGSLWLTESCSNNCSINVPAAVQGALPQSGTYTVSVEDSDHDEPGSMSMSLTCLLANCPDPRMDVALGSNYCPANANSSGNAAVISASGSNDPADNYVNLLVTDAPAAKFGLFFAGPNVASTPIPGSQGVLCIGNPQYRLQPLTMTCANGTATRRPDLNNLPQGAVVTPGSTWNFQFWFRDSNPTATSNLTSAVAVTF